jgi:hypothetical protein
LISRIALCIVLLLSPLSVAADEADVVKRGSFSRTVYAAGANVDIDAEIGGDVLAAGGRVGIGQRVKGSVMAAGGLVALTGRVGEDARLAGGRIAMDAVIGGDLVAAGGRIVLAPAAVVTGDLWLAGGRIVVVGQIGGGVKIAGRHIAIGGDIAGDVELIGQFIEILPGTAIRGRLIYRSPEPARIDPDAQVAGGVAHETLTWPSHAANAARMAATVLGFGFAAALVVLSLVFVLLFPGYAVAAARAIGRRPWASLGLGFALLVAVPVGALLALVTVIGSPLSLALVAVYLLSLPLGYTVAAFYLGDLGLRLIGRAEGAGRLWRALSLIAGIVALGSLGALPWIGGAVPVVALTFGLGAAYLEAFRRWRGVVEPASA